MSVNANVKDNNELVIIIKDTGVGIDLKYCQGYLLNLQQDPF